LTLVLPAFGGAAVNSWSLASPDGQCTIAVSLEAGQLSYEASRDGKRVILKSPLGLRRDDQDFERVLVFVAATEPENRPERYELFAGPQPRIDHILSHRCLRFRNAGGAPFEIELAASAEGVAFRYRFPETNASVRIIQSEQTGFKLPANARGWLQPYHAASQYTPAYEDFYFHVSPGTQPPNSRAKAVGWAIPALFHVPAADTWVLLTESGTDEFYCACHLAPDSPDGLYRIAFALADEATRRRKNQYGPEPRSALPWTLPWRVLVMGKTAGAIALEALVTDLAPPSRIPDTSWIKPGRASWAWWSYPDGPATAKLFNEFTDFAADMGWEYTLFDAGWWKPGLTGIAEHARSKGVKPLAWNYAGDFYAPDAREAKLNEMSAAGVSGVKVDFWCSDRQEAIAAQQALFRDAAGRKLTINLHGCTIPRGWQRTWPNLLTCEAVLGCESYFYEPRYAELAAELDTVLPFTRNAVGPMDLTPIACSPKRYARTTTAAHQLAAALIFTSGIVHYADSPQFFASLPAEAVKVFRDAPARWHETRCLLGDPGKVVVFARRAGKSWFIAGINGTKEKLPVNLDLSPFKDFPRRIALLEGQNPNMQIAASTLDYSVRWKHVLPARGGFILRFDQ
jgi:hypothetical protein